MTKTLLIFIYAVIWLVKLLASGKVGSISFETEIISNSKQYDSEA